MARYGLSSIQEVLKRYTLAEIRLMVRLASKRRAKEMQELVIVAHPKDPAALVELLEARAEEEVIETPKEEKKEWLTSKTS